MTSLHPGYIPDSYDASDRRYTYRGEPKTKNDIRAASLLVTSPEAFKPDPAPSGLCVVDAVAAAIRFLAFRNNNNLPARPSRRFLYYNSRALALMGTEGGDPTQWPEAVEDTAVQIRHAMQAVSAFGVAAEETYPWIEQELRGGGGRVVLGLNDRSLNAAYSEGRVGPAIECNRLDTIPPPTMLGALDNEELKALGVTTLANVKHCLVEGCPIVFAFRLFWDKFQSVPPSTTGSDEGYPFIGMIPAGRPFVGPDPTKGFRTHVGLIIGFNQDKRRVLVKGIWPEQEGQPSSSLPPCFWMSYEWITDVRATMDFWTLRESTPSSHSESQIMKVPRDQDFLELDGRERQSIIDRIPVIVIQAPSMASTSTISACTRNSGPVTVQRYGSGDRHILHMHVIDMVWVADDGAVEHCYHGVADIDRITRSQRDKVSGGGSAAPGSVALVAQAVRRDVFWIDQDGSVQQAYDRDTNPVLPSCAWTYVTVAPVGSAQPGAGLAAALRPWAGMDSFQLYWVGPQGSIENANSVVQRNTWTRGQVAGPGSATLLSNLSAASHHFNFFGSAGMDGVWWIAPNGMVRGAYSANGIDWTMQNWAQEEAKLPVTATAALNSRLAACAFGNEGHFKVLYITPAGMIRGRRYTAEVADQEAYGGSPARSDSGLQLSSTEAVWVSPNNALMMGDKDGITARPLSKPGCIMPGTPLGLAYTKPNSFLVAFTAYDDSWAFNTWE